MEAFVMKLFRTITLVGACLAFAGSSAFAQTTTPPPAKPTAPATKPAAKPKPTIVLIKDLPTAVTDACKAAHPKGTITKATSTGTGTTADPVIYTLTVKTGTKIASHKYTADGKPFPVIKK
jgi:hypothetical protein